MFFAQIVFMTKLLVFDVFQLGTLFLIVDDGEICLTIPDPEILDFLLMN